MGPVCTHRTGPTVAALYFNNIQAQNRCNHRAASGPWMAFVPNPRCGDVAARERRCTHEDV